MADRRPTRWQKAKQDWPGFRLRGELTVAIVGGLLGAAALLLFGWGDAAIQQVVVVAVAAILAAVLLPLGQLFVAWLQAPKRLQAEDVIALRAQVDELVRLARGEAPTAGRSEAPVNVRLWVLDAVRRAQDLTIRGSGVASVKVDAWSSEVFEFLSQHGTPEEAERFSTASGYLLGRIEALKAIAKARRDSET